MSLGTVVGNFAGNGALVVSVEEYFAGKYSLLVTGTAGVFGTLTVKGGTGAAREVVKVTDPTNGASHSDLVIGAVGAYVFEVQCDSLEFVLAGSTTPDLDLTLFPESRP